MLPNGTVNHNGHLNGTNGHLNGTNGHTLVCDSDYEPRPVIDVMPRTQKPAWSDQLAPYTHSLSWSDSDGCTHSLTLRNDTLEGLLGDLKLIKQGIKIAKAKHTENLEPQAELPADTQRCEIHGVEMPRRWSKRTNGHYFGHKLSDGSFCYGHDKP